MHGASQVALMVKNPHASAGEVRDAGLISGSERSPRGEHGNLLQYSFLIQWQIELFPKFFSFWCFIITVWK